MTFLTTLALPRQIILDGATGTELNRRNVNTGLPLWSANALLNEHDAKILQDIHEDYLHAGAEIITTNTFRTHRRALAPSGNADLARKLTHRAVEIARLAIENVRSDSQKFIAGSLSTLEDCYRPDLVPPDDELLDEHSDRIIDLIECGVDLILIETINSIREAFIMAKLATFTGTPVVVSFVCDQTGKILSGETLTEAAELLLPLGISAIGVNCGPTPSLAKPLAELNLVCGQEFPLIAYGNIGHADEKIGWINTDAENPEIYCEHAIHWPVKIVGGCCGTTPGHIQILEKTLTEKR